MSKTTKIALNYGLGLVITLVLLWSLYHQLRSQLEDIGSLTWWRYDTWPCFAGALLLIPVNLGVEARKWQLLAGSAIPVSYAEAVKSLLGGIAFSMITPNRIGEYPGRILFLKHPNSTRLISVSVLGGCSQLLALMLAGCAGLVYYNLQHTGLPSLLALAGCLLLTIGIGVFYWRFERWSPLIERVSRLRKLRLYGQLLGRFSTAAQSRILGLALLRLAVFTLQYYLMLRWMAIPLPLVDGLFLCALFFWAMAVIPSIALAELGIRATVSLFLFGAFTANKLGLLAATTALWCLNLAIPALIGSILLLRLKLWR